MRILFDHNTPAPLRHALSNHTVETAGDREWDRLSNGNLLDAAEAEGFEILVTADKGFQHEQNLTGRRIAIVILSRGNWPDVRASIAGIRAAIEAATGGTCTLVECARPRESTE